MALSWALSGNERANQATKSTEIVKNTNIKGSKSPSPACISWYKFTNDG